MRSDRFDLLVLGAGPAYPDRPGATGASYLLSHPGGDRVLLDLGQGSFPRLHAALPPEQLTAVLVSHLHPDHFIDLVPLRHYLRYELDPPGRVRVHAPRDLATRIDALHAAPGFTAEALEVTALHPGRLQAGTFSGEARRVTHTEDSWAFRISAGDGPGLAYSGDCGVADDLEPLIRPGDTLLVEVSFGPGPVPPGAQHLDGPAVGRLAAATRPAAVWLTHLQMGYSRAATLDAVRTRYDGPVRFVGPGDRLAIA